MDENENGMRNNTRTFQNESRNDNAHIKIDQKNKTKLKYTEGNY